jgi:glycosyltransferase involved in cell wall biosynthesis
LHLLEDPAIAEQLGRDARQYAVSHFDWSVASRRYRDILLHLSR